ncbi:hypothetical protein [Crystallibacter crystallopoietes]|nr:hypothetical protein [Arthrobacter crystallopoietes]
MAVSAAHLRLAMIRRASSASALATCSRAIASSSAAIIVSWGLPWVV